MAELPVNDVAARLRGILKDWAERARRVRDSLSLRARLLLIALSLVAVGLTIAGIATYSSLRSFLLDRVDDQLAAAQRPAGRLIGDQVRGFGGRGGGEPRQGELPKGIEAGLFAMDGTRLSPTIGTATAPLPRSESDGYYTAELTGAEYRFLSTTLTDPAGGADAQFIVGIPLADVNDTLGRLLAIELLVGLGVLGAVGGLGFWLVRLGLRPLRDIEDTAGAIAAGDLSRRIDEADGRTEVGRLGKSLNTMLATIEEGFKERQASEQRLRQFVADASHELQTPLTSVRGYAELFRRGAADRPEDLANAMQRIEAESERMGLLVDDLLLLARLDQGRPLANEPVDLAEVARELVVDARVVDSDRRVTLTADAPVVVTGDKDRLRQVVANLLRNARTHTPPGTAVSVAVRSEGSEAVIEVADEGPGMHPEHAARVFERFFRADPSRTRASGGTGLGLSIVSAIVEAHGGTVGVDTAPGDGARFRVVLPDRQSMPAPPDAAQADARPGVEEERGEPAPVAVDNASTG